MVKIDCAQKLKIPANSGSGQDKTGQTAVWGSVLTFKLDTNPAAFTTGGRGNNINGYLATYGPIDLTEPVNSLCLYIVAV